MSSSIHATGMATGVGETPQVTEPDTGSYSACQSACGLSVIFNASQTVA